ncbi:MAG: MBL fold metallo-hydrolase [Candidatus Aminicenantes bacterium]|nr:MBL fold metallo-hydrolase [Candidatus Aminicenantes bacterium]
MRRKTLPFVSLIVLTALAGLPAAAGTVEGLPLHVKMISPGVVRVWVGDYVSSTAVCAVATRKGVVVIDTTNIPKLDQAFRKVIARELGRSDFKYLINTHGHADHVSGNGVYADCTIIAHEGVKAMMEEDFRDIPRRVQWMDESIQGQKERLASGEVKEEGKAAALEQLAYSSLVIEYLKSSPKPTFPTKTFRDKMVLDCGDVTFELYQAGGTHTRNDIFILVPQKGILFTGDTMADKWLSDTPGCLATFALRTGQPEDFPVLMRNWQALLERKDEIQHYIPGHWNGELSYEGFKARFGYAQGLLADVGALAKSNGDFSQFVTGYTLKEKFPHLVNSPGITLQGHMMSLNHLYTIFSGKTPVADELRNLFADPSTFSAGFAKLRDAVLNARGKYFVSEAELNNIGYFLLGEQKEVEASIMLFEFNAELHPGSWNASDSLAEGYYAKGDKKKALELYRKSLELNPGNDNARKLIERITKELGI